MSAGRLSLELGHQLLERRRGRSRGRDGLGTDVAVCAARFASCRSNPGVRSMCTRRSRAGGSPEGPWRGSVGAPAHRVAAALLAVHDALGGQPSAHQVVETSRKVSIHTRTKPVPAAARCSRRVGGHLVPVAADLRDLHPAALDREVARPGSIPELRPGQRRSQDIQVDVLFLPEYSLWPARKNSSASPQTLWS